MLGSWPDWMLLGHRFLAIEGSEILTDPLVNHWPLVRMFRAHGVLLAFHFPVSKAKTSLSHGGTVSSSS